jgi:hypothetical protein
VTCTRSWRIVRGVSFAAALALGAEPALAQQFRNATTSLFPAPPPLEWTNQLTIGDLDGDGDLDIVWANGGNFSSPGAPQVARVYINNGSGFFSDETAARTGNHAGLYRGVELGDCDRDGDLDVILAQDFNRLPQLLINNGAGVFTVEGATRLPPLTLSSSRAQFGDVDNDGDLDIFITNGGSVNRFGCGQYRLYRNDGTCHYTDATATNFPIGNVCENQDCIFGDIDNDFDIDIRTASTGTNNSRLYRNDGTGVFTVAPVPADDTSYSYDFGDIDGDGDLDLFGANAAVGSNRDNVLLNGGTGNYSDVTMTALPTNPNTDDNDSKFFDYDNDGDLDLLIARLGAGGEQLLANDGTGRFTVTTGVVEVVTDSSLDVMVADLTGDGAPEIVTAQGESGDFTNRVYFNNGAPDARAPRIIDMEQHPDTNDVTGPYVVRALVLDDLTSDRNFFDDGIELHWAVGRGGEVVVPMLHSGGQVYRGEIPGQPFGTTIDYFVVARDRAGNEGTGPTLAFDVRPSCSGVSDCSGNGTCVANDTCACFVGWIGPDCSTMAASGAGRVPDGGPLPGTPLTVAPAGGGDITLSWGASCVSSDTDYEVYEGTLGSFTTHAPRTCSTSGALSFTLTPAAGSAYYLVVPRNATREGSYGEASSGAERPPSGSACVIQDLADCPP